VRVRAATGADADAVARVQQETWRVAYAHVFPAEGLGEDFIDVERWRRRLIDPPPGWSTFVAERDGRLVGFSSVGPSRDEGGIGELYAIYVDPPEWSTGAGRALLERSEQRLAEEYHEATLWVLEDNPRARRFYELAGWRTDGARKAEPRWDVSAAEVRYRKRLV